MTVSAGIFREYDIRGVVGQDLTNEAARAVGVAYAAYLADRHVHGRLVVGRDNRPSGVALHEALLEGLTSSGVDVIDIGVVPTPLMYWGLNHLDVVGGIQITGSHNPPEFNGFKICRGTSSVYGAEIQELYRLVQQQRRPEGRGTVHQEDVVERYVDDIAARIGPLDRRVRVVHDCGNGAGAIVAPRLFARLGVESRGLFCESDGTFPNHHPDPTIPENLEALIAAVRDDGAELGIAFDGDADRIGVVDDRGTIVWGDRLLILYARDVLARTGAGQPVIFDVKCSQALPDAIAAAHGTPIMARTGHALIKEKMKEMHAPIAGEMSGHMFFTEGFYGHDDALYGAARLLRVIATAGRSVRELLADVPTYFATPELRVDCADALKFDIVARAVAHFRAQYNVIDVDGVRVQFGDGWGLIRASNTQPVIVTRFEARTEARLRAIRDEMEGWLRAQGVQV